MPMPERTASESAYRRGVHQALAYVGHWLRRCHDLEEARERLSAAESAAHDFRYTRRDGPYGPMLLLDNVEAAAFPAAARPKPTDRPVIH